MGEVVKLVDASVSKETVDTLLALLEEARDGKVVGLTYVALHNGRKFTADVVGESRRSPVYTMGTLASLTSFLLALIEDPGRDAT